MKRNKSITEMKNEYFVKYRIDTVFHEPYNETLTHYYSDVVEAENGSEAVRKILSDNSFSNPNMSTEIVSIKKINV
jgi:hypothetical protein